MKFLKFVPIAVLLLSGTAIPVRAEEPVPCLAYTVDSSNPRGLPYEEINNCPMTGIGGAFSDKNWRVAIGKWETALYTFRLWNRQTGELVLQMMDFDVSGTTERPQYRFTPGREGSTAVVVSFQYVDPDFIRVEIFENGEQTFNQLLERDNDPVPRI